jgi:hypothetical protein
MKKLLSAALAITALAVPAVASAAPSDSAGNGHAYGQKIKSDFGASYGQVLNSFRGVVLPGHGDDPVFPPAAGAKAFYEIHGS